MKKNLNKYYMDIADQSTVIKNKEILDKFSININIVKKVIYFVALLIGNNTYVTFQLNHHLILKMRRLKYMIFDKHWLMMFVMIIFVNILVNVVKVDTMNDSEQ